MRITLFNDLETRIAAVIMKEQMIMKITAAIITVIKIILTQKQLIQAVFKLISESVFESVSESAFKSVAESVHEFVHEHVFKSAE